MQTTKSLGPPIAGAHWSLGPKRMCRISEATAKQLLVPHPLPRMGYETNAQPATDEYRHNIPLVVQNISGSYYLASYQCNIEHWPEVYGVTVVDDTPEDDND